MTASARIAGQRSRLRLTPRPATPESAAPFGVMLGADVPNPGLAIPYYRASVIEGEPLPFACEGATLVRAARILPRTGEIVWLERHLRVTQTFVGLGDAPFLLVLAPPTHARAQVTDPRSRSGDDVPELGAALALHFRAGQGIMLHAGTWHEFPLALGEAATVLTINSREIVETLAGVGAAAELDRGDVRKILVSERLGVDLEVDLAPPSP